MRSTSDPDGTGALRQLVLVASLAGLVVLVVAAVSLPWDRGSSTVAGSAGGEPPPTAPAPPVPSALEKAALAQSAAPAPRPSTPRVPPKWIWSNASPAPNEEVRLRRTIATSGTPQRVVLRVSADNTAVVRLNGREIGRSSDWMTPLVVTVTGDGLAPGPDGASSIVMEIDARNEGGPAGVVATVEIVPADGPAFHVATDERWESLDPDGSIVGPSTVLATFGGGPWGAVPGVFDVELDRHIVVPPGFVAELVCAVPRSQGSWVSLAADDRGRLLASDQGGGVYRITPMPIGSEAEATVVESIDLPVGAAQGLAVVDGTLYCVISENRAEGPGFYRVRDTDGDDRYDEATLLRGFTSGGEHGPHAVVEGPDGMLYIVAGNHTPLPDPERSLVPRCWSEDLLLPRLWDAGGHAVGILAPGGWICRTDRDGSMFELVAIGLRNAYDIAFDDDGELFTYDADMEWDMGAPWYRPTRLCHVVSGAEFGWRSGTGKWPAEHPDSVPPVLDLGPGSPTGLAFGRGTNFPEPYRSALFALDWTFGTMRAIHLRPSGAGFAAETEVFMTGQPLPLADAVANEHDGALYLVVGGRGLPSAILRVRWVGEDPGAARLAASAAAEDPVRALRHRLEALHRFETVDEARAGAGPEDIDLAWSALGHDDRLVRYAARVALEHQPPDRWIDRLAGEQRTAARIAATIAAARCGAAGLPTLLAGLDTIPWNALDEHGRLDLLRARSLCLIRLGKPDALTCRSLAAPMESIYPTGQDLVDRQLCDLLVFLDSPVVVARTVPLMERADASPAEAVDEALLGRSESYGQVILRMAASQPQRQQVHDALALRCATKGWTPDLRERYFRWFESARRTSGGLSFVGFLDNIRADALARMPEAERKRYADRSEDDLFGSALGGASAERPQPVGPGRAWTTDEAAALARDGWGQRSYENGQRMFAAAMCIQCHRFAGTGRMGGPDLTTVPGRFTIRDLAEAVIEPSRTVSDQYRQSEFVVRNDRVVIGRIVDRDEQGVTVVENLLAPQATTRLPAADIVAEHPSLVSPMMPHLVDRLNGDELLDLLAYLLSGGDPRHAVYSGAASGG
ncbi:MAG: c-type cytochrome [Phycisphaerales bacterium]|nr:c-type cytochrome [Phycisphaerales bacterium]